MDIAPHHAAPGPVDRIASGSAQRTRAAARRWAITILCLSLTACGVKGPLTHEDRQGHPEKQTREWDAKPPPQF